jgi:CheY-like chemotaxis protein
MRNRQSVILVVDDNATNLKLVSMLAFEGYQIVTATDAEEAPAFGDISSDLFAGENHLFD